MWKKIVNFVAIALLLFFFVLTGIQYYTNRDLKRSLDRYRSDLEYARGANERYADAYRRATETNSELGRCLSEHVTTLSQLRSQLQAIRARYEQMSAILEGLADGGYNLTDTDGTGDGGDGGL